MLNPYEIVSKSALPALRAMISRRLREQYKLTQQDIATRLGVTQASVSNYERKARGVMINLETDPTIAKSADRVAAMLASTDSDQRDALRTMTEMCDYIRFNHLMCALHKDLEPGFDTEGCDACAGFLGGRELTRLKLITG
ncbi:MAG: helix-turn-helix domain-containing protein [Thaumarchaeota archaeon]|nr:helix-turn-helix domain-containing protein [Nitrososphaerota archaeon]